MMAELPTSANQEAVSINFWQGKRIRLRGIDVEDAPTFNNWNFDSEMARAVDFVWPPTSLQHTRNWAQKASEQEFKDDTMTCAIETLQGQLVGSINSHSINRRVGNFGYGIAIGIEHRGHGYASEAIILFLRYFFDELRYQKCTAPVYSFNNASMRLHEKLGFQLEGRLRRTLYTRGQYFDELFYGMTCEEFYALYGK